MTFASENFSIALINGHILSDPDVCMVAPHGMTLIRDDKLEEINRPCDPRVSADKVIDCTNCLIMPGMINSHSHSGMGLLRGLADDMALDTWLNHFIFPVEKKFVNADFVYLSSMVSMMEMVLGGITTCADGYYFMESTALAAIDLGMRSVVAQGILDVATPDAPVQGGWKERAMEFLESCPTSDLVQPALFCHSPYLCGPRTLTSAAELAKGRDLRIFCHISETESEVKAIRSLYNLSPVAYLKDLGLLGEDFVAVHSIHVTPYEIDLLADTGTKVVHCPESNMKLGSGAAPIAQMLDRKINIGIGTDSVASNNNLDLIEEMRTAAFLGKFVASDPRAVDAKCVVRMATIEGARALGISHKVGSLESGKRADVTVVDMSGIHLTPVYDMISQLVYCARGSDVRDVIINGQVVVRNREIRTVDQWGIKTRATEKSRDILASF